MANSRYDQHGNPEHQRHEQERYGQSRRGAEGRQGEQSGQGSDESRQWGNDQYGRAGGYGEEEAMGGQGNRVQSGYGQNQGGRSDQDHDQRGGRHGDPQGGYMGSRAALGGFLGGGMGMQGAFPSQQTMGQGDREGDHGYGATGSDQGAARGSQGGGYAGYGYGGQGAGGQNYGGNRGRQSGDDRGFLQRAGEEISSWFESDENRSHRGKGPQGYTRSDQRIEEDVNDRLCDDPMVDASDIKVRVAEGEVTLEGEVDSKHVKRIAEDCADRVSGVKHIQNNLRVKRPGGMSGQSLAGQSSAGQQSSGQLPAGQPGNPGLSGTTTEPQKSSNPAMTGKKDD